VHSPYVDFETMLGVEFFASGNIQRLLAICIDDVAFEQASANIKLFNIVRKILSVESAARLIQGNLISAASIRPCTHKRARSLSLQIMSEVHPKAAVF